MYTNLQIVFSTFILELPKMRPEVWAQDVDINSSSISQCSPNTFTGNFEHDMQIYQS